MAQETLAQQQARLNSEIDSLQRRNDLNAQELKDLSDKQAALQRINDLLTSQANYDKERLKIIDSILDSYKNLRAEQEGLTEEGRKELLYQLDLREEATKLLRLQQEKQELLRKNQRLEEEYAKAGAARKAEIDREIQNNEIIIKQKDKEIHKQDVKTKGLESYYEAGEESFNATLSWAGITDERQKLSTTQSILLGKVSGEAFERRAKQFFSSGVAMERIFLGFAEKVLEMSLIMARQLDVVRAETYKAAGGFTELGDQVMAASEMAGISGVSFDSMNKSYMSLIKSSSNFTEMTNSQRSSVAKNNAQLAQLGISADVAAKNFSIFTQSLGMTVQQANASSRELVSLANNLHMSFEEISAGFGEAATTVAAYGQGAVREFSKLAAESKALGLSVQELINIVKGADTFQGAAEQAGKLNAMLGGGLLNSSQLLVASESERIQLIRDAVMQTGRSFSTMSKYEQIAIANAAGIQDLTVAQKLFNSEISGGELDRYLGKTNALGMSQEQMAEQAASAQETQEKLKILMEQFAAAMSPVVSGLAAIVNLFMVLAPYIKTAATLYAALIVIKYGYAAASTTLTIAINAVRLAHAAGTKQTVGYILSLGRAAMAAVASGIRAAGSAVFNFLFASSMGAVELSTGRAVLVLLLVIGAFYLLYQILHKSGSPMLYAIFGFMAIGIFLFGEALNKNKQGILAFGAAMLMVGTGAFMAFHGLEGFAIALAALDPTQLAALVGVIIILAITMVVLFAIVISAGSAAVGPMLALGVAFLLIGAGAYLAGLGLSLVVNAFANLATNIVALLLLPLFLQLMAVGFIALTLSLYAFGTTLPIIMLAIPLLFALGIVLGIIATSMLVAGVASVIFGSGLMLIGIALSNFTTSAATGIIAVVGSLIMLQYALIGIGASMVMFGGPIMAAISMIGLMALALSAISPEKSIALRTTVDSIQDFASTGKNITPETVSNLENVVKQIHKLNIEATISKAVNVTAPFKELIDAINGQTAATAAGKETTVVMKLNDREFGKAVVGVMNSYGTLNTSMRKPTPA